jgi:glyoxylase-like metal-dependent hydrolase (beta-lactamase superfamily II)
VTRTADPRPAQLPIAGGREGATVTVQPLRTAEILAMPHFLQRPSGPLAEVRGLGLLTPRSRWSRIPVPCFLVEHPGVGAILVDTGLQASVAEHPAATLGHRAALVMDIAMEAGWAAAAQLRERGVEPEDVRVAIMTHLHYDHAGAVADFPQATFVVDAAEWAAASGGGFLHGYRRALIDHPFDWRLLSFDASEVGSFASFGRAIDLFADGSVQLLSTPGHSKGHLSVLLRLSGGRELLLTADAAYARRSIDDGLVPVFVDDVHRYRRSLAEIRRYVEQTPSATVICGHDAEGWADVHSVYR